VWQESSNILTVSDNGEGPIRVQDFCLYPRHVGCFYTMRFANVDTQGRLYTRDPITGSNTLLDTVDNMQWSKIQFASHDDQLVFESQGPANGNSVVADLEVVRARRLDRMRGRYTREA